MISAEKPNTILVVRVGQWGTYAKVVRRRLWLEAAIQDAVDLKRGYPQCHYVIMEPGKPAWRCKYEAVYAEYNDGHKFKIRP